MYQVKHKGIRGKMSAQHSARCTILPPYGGYAYRYLAARLFFDFWEN